jgi:hypothetical protein
MKLLVLAPLVIASTAYAQAPGDYYGDASIAPPGMAPEVAPDPQPPLPPPPRLRRFSIGLGIGHASLAPHSAPDNTTEFDVGQIALRYLVRRNFEIELALTGGSETLDDGSAGGKELSQAVLAVRYRFSPQRRWNWWLMAGMGTLAVTNTYASDDERDAASQSTLQFGVGIERRWSRFAIQGELRAVGVAKNDDMDDAPQVDMPVSSMDPYPGTVGTPTYGGKKGGQFALTANYYF